MKKSTFILTTIITCFSLTSCNNKNDTKSDLIFSEIIEGSSNNRAVEIYNVSEKELDLTKYKIEIQMVSKIIEINLEGSIKPKETYSIVYSDACEELKNKANLLTEDLKFIGSQPLLLKKGKKTLDVLGLEGYQIEYCKNLTLARKEEYLIGRNTFDEYDWIRYSEDNFKYLGTIKPSVSEIELLEGPKLVDSDYENPFYVTNDKNELIGGGGLIDVTVKSYVDGDTTCFNYPDEIFIKEQKCDIKILTLQKVMKVMYKNLV